MKSATKVELSTQQLCLAVKAAFGPSVEVTQAHELPDGWFNTIYDLELSDGRRVILKLAPKPGVPTLRYEQGLLATEVGVYRLLSGLSGVPVPQVFYEDPGSLLGIPFFFMEKIDAPTYANLQASLSAEDRRKIEIDLGRVNARINQVKGPAFGSLRDEGFHSSRWTEVFERMVSDVLADGHDQGTDLPWEADPIMGLVKTHRAALELVREPRLVHWDLHAGNTFIDGTVVRAVIDGDRALWGDPLMEAYFRSLVDPTWFLEGYGAAVLQSPGAPVRRALYDVYLGLVMLVECDFRGYTPEHRAWARGNLVQTLEASV